MAGLVMKSAYGSGRTVINLNLPISRNYSNCSICVNNFNIENNKRNIYSSKGFQLNYGAGIIEGIFQLRLPRRNGINYRFIWK